MSLSNKEIDHIASLARLRLTDEEKARYRQQWSAVLDYLAKLGEVDTTPIPPTATVLPLRTVLRPDRATQPLSVLELLANAPEAEDDMFRVPPVLDGGGEGG